MSLRPTRFVRVIIAGYLSKYCPGMSLQTTPDEKISMLNLKCPGYLAIIRLKMLKISNALVHLLLIFPSLHIQESDNTPQLISLKCLITQYWSFSLSLSLRLRLSVSAKAICMVRIMHPHPLSLQISLMPCRQVNQKIFLQTNKNLYARLASQRWPSNCAYEPSFRIQISLRWMRGITEMSECLIEQMRLVLISPILERVLLKAWLKEVANWPLLSSTDWVRLGRQSQMLLVRAYYYVFFMNK